ncbi:hypothetical protein N7468_000340 [Penicillium chermesinum]|uniref:Uncharacterized protein n=1 Tax=Penicillium chermesinum TaxID=63820 RepID=A0A9W9PN43_9EURO|nr:uncharacterized protein N7468_000340 [Penicillium chermesinum]KAJ5248889.1 hypothetical protein N7468_000340 [Penicillium chermesinum]
MPQQEMDPEIPDERAEKWCREFPIEDHEARDYAQLCCLYQIMGRCKRTWPRKVGAWMNLMIKLDITIREVIQREEYLIQKSSSVLGQIKAMKEEPYSQQNLDNWQDELQRLNQDYWRIDRELSLGCLCWSDTFYRPIFRAYNEVRKDPVWYLSDLLCNDCASRGGCCGRACKCCEKPSATRSRARGHCTKECGCCIEFRGFELKKDQQKLCQPAFNLKGGLESNAYSIFLFKAYILGLHDEFSHCF